MVDENRNDWKSMNELVKTSQHVDEIGSIIFKHLNFILILQSLADPACPSQDVSPSGQEKQSCDTIPKLYVPIGQSSQPLFAVSLCPGSQMCSSSSGLNSLKPEINDIDDNET